MINNKNILLPFLTLAILTFAISGCKKYAGDSYDFSDTTKHYMMFSSSSLTFNNGIDDMGTEDDESDDVYELTPKNIPLSTRVGFVDPIQVSYTIAINGGTPQNLNYTYPAFSTSKGIATTFDASKFPAGVDVITGTITLKSATGDKYGPLVSGYPDPETGVTITFKAYRPGSLVHK